RKAKVECLYGLEIEAIENEPNKVAICCKNGWKLHAQKVLVTTNGFAKNLLPQLQLIPARNQVLVTKPIKKLKFKGCFHYDSGYYYFRNVGNRILLGGGRNLAKQEETTDQFGQTDLIQRALLKILQDVILPEQEIAIEQWWSGILGVGEHKKPIIRMLNEQVGVAVRLGGMGVAIGTNVGERAAAMLAD
ncbi:MAG: FAD-dependent oxidoreductase, partial [Bacteroidota bacterium]